MYERTDAKKLNDLLLPLGRRNPRGVYFARVCGGGDGVTDALWAFHEAARQKGVIIEGQIGNPDERQLSYLNETLGTAFEANEAFIVNALNRWMPRMQPERRREFARSLCAQFDELRRQGKTDSILRNIYFKAMCWLYYKFERLMPFLGAEEPPRILYECSGITGHELILLRILNGMGADILLLEPNGDAAYLKQDPQSKYSQLLVTDAVPFPKGFCLKQLRREMAERNRPAPKPIPPKPVKPTPIPPKPAPSTPIPPAPVKPGPVTHQPRPAARTIDLENYFKKPARAACTNAWMKAPDIDQILTPVVSRGDDFNLFYNAFIRQRGVNDKLTYLNELHQFYQKFNGTGRRIVIVDGGLSMPGQDEIGRIRRRNYRTVEEMIVDLAVNLPGSASVELQRLMQWSFVETLRRAQKEQPTLSRLLISAVYLLCWINRYQGQLFQGYRDGDVPCFVLMGGCKNAHDVLYPLFLSRLPVDVLILAPDLNRPCALKDDRLLELKGTESLSATKFPRDAVALQLRTLAAHAEDDLTAALYSDSGLYRDRQFSRAEAMTLQSTCDELFLLWNEELKYRSGFATVENTVTMPVLYAKVSGVEKGNVDAYWQKVRTLLGKDTYLVKRMPLIAPGAPNPYQALALKAVRNGTLNRKALREHRQYPFGLIREELQQHMLDKLQMMLERRMIRGTFENGTEYTVVSTVLNLDKTLLRMLQSFDFTKKNPKVVCISTDDRGASLEDAVLLTFLNLVGFDIALFVPTGYQTIERYLNDNRPVEHQAGDYLYDLTAPDFDQLPPPKGRSWLDQLLKRGK